MMDELEELLVIAQRPLSVSTTVIFNGHTIFKSILILQLNGNVFLDERIV